MSEKRFTLEQWTKHSLYYSDGEYSAHMSIGFICEKVEKKLNEQEATIRKLQDLCGKSDGENAKLRIENKMLEKEVNLLRPTNLEQYEQIQKLQEENEQLRAKLREKEQDERLYANEIVKLNKEAKEVLDFKSLGGDY
jgi:chromosome segregation ATPase